jgi:hypothetical protein
MRKKNEIGKISFEFNKAEIEAIATKGDLSAFVDKATELFRLNLKAELVNGVSSGSTSLVAYDDRYGTGPKGPFPHIFKEIDMLKANLFEEIHVLKDSVENLATSMKMHHHN